MPFQILDFILLGIMLISGVLALSRGFTREVLSLVSWGAAAVAAYFAIQQPQALAFVEPYVAKIAVGAAAFIVVLIVVSIISVKISDRVVDSAVGAFDRTLGFIYGLARGLVLVAIAYMLYGWVSPPEKQEDWIRNAQSLPIIRSVSDVLVGLMPPDVRETLEKSANIGSADSKETPPAAEGDGTGYNNGQTQGLENLVDGVKPAQPQ
jgi:membrane protein required for colicin V production